MKNLILPVFLMLSWFIALTYLFFFIHLELTQGVIHKLFYFHVSSAMVSFIGFTLSFLLSWKWIFTSLESNQKKIFSWIHNLNKISILFSVFTLITGSFWAKPIWGIFWNWNDVRLVTFLILVLFYLMFFMITSGSEYIPSKIKAGIFWNVLSYLNIPLVYFSIQWWGGSLHPRAISMPGNMVNGLILTFIAQLFLFITLVKICFHPRRNYES